MLCFSNLNRNLHSYQPTKYLPCPNFHSHDFNVSNILLHASTCIRLESHYCSRSEGIQCYFREEAASDRRWCHLSVHTWGHKMAIKYSTTSTVNQAIGGSSLQKVKGANRFIENRLASRW
eukprot:c8056_g2_i1 orf=513-872(+)